MHRVLKIRITPSVPKSTLSMLLPKMDTSTAHDRALLIKQIQEAGGELDAHVNVEAIKINGSKTIRPHHCKIVYQNDTFYISQTLTKGKDVFNCRFEVNADGSLPWPHYYDVKTDTLAYEFEYIPSSVSWLIDPELEY